MAAKYKLMKTFSAMEVEEKMEMGLCFLCDEAFTLGHYELKHKNIKIVMKDIDEDEVEPERADLWQQGGDLSSNNKQVPQTTKREEVQGVVEDSLQRSVFATTTPVPTGTPLPVEHEEKGRQLQLDCHTTASTTILLKPSSVTDSALFFFNPLMLDDDGTKESHGNILQAPNHNSTMELGVDFARMKEIKIKEADWGFTEQSSASIQTQFSTHSSRVDSQVILNLEHSLNIYITGLEHTILLPANFPKPTFSSHISDHPPPPEPPDQVAVPTSPFNLSLSVTTTEHFAASQYQGISAYSFLQPTPQLFDEMPKCHIAVWNVVSSRYMNNEMENVTFDLSKGLNLICVALGHYTIFNIFLLCSLEFFNFGMHKSIGEACSHLAIVDAYVYNLKGMTLVLGNMLGDSWLKILGQGEETFDEKGSLIFGYNVTIRKIVMAFSVGNKDVKSFKVSGTLVDCVSLALCKLWLNIKIALSANAATKLRQVLNASGKNVIQYHVEDIFSVIICESETCFSVNNLVVLMHLEFYSLAKRDLNIKCVLQYHEEIMMFISEITGVQHCYINLLYLLGHYDYSMV